jgi:hypothetical protein
MLLWDVAVTTEQHQKNIYGSASGEEFYTKSFSFFLLLNLKISPNLNLVLS